MNSKILFAIMLLSVIGMMANPVFANMAPPENINVQQIISPISQMDSLHFSWDGPTNNHDIHYGVYVKELGTTNHLFYVFHSPQNAYISVSHFQLNSMVEITMTTIFMPPGNSYYESAHSEPQYTRICGTFTGSQGAMC